MPVLELTAVTRRFGAALAVDAVSLRVPPAAITGLIGPNGAGKTTLFNLVAGSLRPSAGRITLGGHDIGREPAHRRLARGLARTFQIPRPFPGMTVLENVMLAAQKQSGERAWAALAWPGWVARQERHIADRARGLLDFLDLGRLAQQPARALSGGQRKLLELARALMAEPQLVLLDEPAAGVAPALLDTICDRIATLHARGMGFLIVEHDTAVIRRLCGEVHVMAQGRLLLSGAPDAVLADPRVIDAYLG